MRTNYYVDEAKMNLFQVRDIEWYEGPILSLCRDEAGSLYLRKWADLQHSIVVKTTKELVQEYEDGRLSLLDLLRADGDRGWLEVATFALGGRYPISHSFEEGVVSQMKPSFLPTPDAMHEPELRPKAF